MDLPEGEFLSVVRELAALHAVVVRLGDSLDRVDLDAREMREDGAKNSEKLLNLERDRARLESLVREAEREIQDVSHWVGTIKRKLGIDTSEVIMGDKIEVTGSELKDAQVGTGGQSSSSRSLIIALCLVAALAIAGALGIYVRSDWVEVVPGPEVELGEEADVADPLPLDE